MAEKQFNQEFKGYRLQRGIKSISANSGVYGIYRCVYNEDKDSVNLKQLIYIGKADDLYERLNKHEKWNDFLSYLKKEEQICICYTFVDKQYNERVEAALINSNQPPENTEFKNAFPFDKTIVNCTGNHKFIRTSNIVERN